MSSTKTNGHSRRLSKSQWEDRIREAGQNKFRFIRWSDDHRENGKCKAECECLTCGHVWSSAAVNLVVKQVGCAKCRHRSNKPLMSENYYIHRINAVKNVTFVRWAGEFKGSASKAVYRCRNCGREWSACVGGVIHKQSSCVECSDKIKLVSAERRIAQINSIKDTRFIRWDGEFKGCRGRVVCRCEVCNTERSVLVQALIHNHNGCPTCSETGYNPSKPGTLYFLRSECGQYVKIGISNTFARRLKQLRVATPFHFEPVELINHDDGRVIATYERFAHSVTLSAGMKGFDGATEWRVWDNRVVELVNMLQSR